MINHRADDVKYLIRELNSRDKVTRGYAAKEISSLAKKRIFDVNSIEPLTKLLQDESNPVRYNAAFAIGDLAQYCRVYERNTASKILRFLYDKDEIIRWSGTFAIRALAKRGIFEVASVKLLTDLLKDRNNKVQYNAAFTLGDIAEWGGIFDKNAVSPLIRLLSHNHQRVRWSAAFALKTLAKKGIFNNDSLQSFAGLLLDENERVRYNAAYAIGYLAELGAFDKSTIYPLIGLLSDRNGVVRGGAAFAIGCLAKKDVFDGAAIKPLKSLLSDYNGIVRKNAAEALNKINELPSPEKQKNTKTPHDKIEYKTGSHKWVHSQQSIAILIPKTEMNGLFNKNIIVQPNEVGVIVIDGKVENVVEGGKVKVNSLFKDVEVVMVDTIFKEANWQVEELWTSDKHKIAAKGLLRYRTADPKKFFLMVYAYSTYNENRVRVLTLEDINESIKSEILTRVLQPEVSNIKLDEIYGNRELQHKIENEIELQLKQTLDMWGLELLRFTSEWNLGDNN